MLCQRAWLSAEELALSRKAELAENLKVCLSGEYTALCNHSWLTPEELARVRSAERRENLETCLSGKYQSLCNKEPLSEDELRRVRAAEDAENLRICLDGRFPSLCDRSRLSPEQGAAVPRAQKRAGPKATEAVTIPFSEEPENSLANDAPTRRHYATTRLRLRASPSLEGSVLTTLPSGSRVDVSTCGAGWCEVNYGLVSGYVAERYLAAKPPPSNAGARERSSGRGYINSSGEWVPSPTWTEDGRPPAGASAQCRDGSYSFSRSRRGTCSHHGGVARWL
ncbi:MAG TPA: DUF3761 domain-containing protein [Thermoanaerobaculia bacterium]|nr:DUF3761 domain-containing protein [Thermoanaerobaculia bacterium]